MLEHPSREDKANAQLGNFGYPRPQLVRDRWLSLNGVWRFSANGENDLSSVDFNQQIVVPYPPESALSGLADSNSFPRSWYQRTFDVPVEWRGKRVLLHFGAVDYQTTVWLNGQMVAQHAGGHTPFSVDITAVLDGHQQTVTVLAEDDPHDLHKPRGKQDWLDDPHVIWYPRTSGIWQSVWIEAVPATRIDKLNFRPSLADFSIGLEVAIAGDWHGSSLEVEMTLAGKVIALQTIGVSSERQGTVLRLPDPGIDDARNEFLWTPESPTLIDVRLTLAKNGSLVDSVSSYTALRTIEARGGRLLLNGRPYFMRLVLDQGYWDESHLAAPSDDALRRDVELAKAMGFNGVRKHQKIEHPRYLYWADRLGLLVWTELPSAYSFSHTSSQRLTREWIEVIERDINHPSVVAWVPFNESWGVPDLPTEAPQRHLVAALYHLAKALDPTRPVIGNDGWEFVIGDLFTVHDYSQEPDQLRARYGDLESQIQTAKEHGPAGRAVVLAQAEDPTDLPFLVSEFGGVRFSHEETGWGYGTANSPDDLLEKYSALVAALTPEAMAGFCYTQFADTFQEQNGLLFSNRTPKIDLVRLARATRGEVIATSSKGHASDKSRP